MVQPKNFVSSDHMTKHPHDLLSFPVELYLPSLATFSAGSDSGYWAEVSPLSDGNRRSSPVEDHTQVLSSGRDERHHPELTG
jgi:hypothetical protein